MFKFLLTLAFAKDDFPLFTINLDLPADQRFKEPAAHFREDMVLAMNELTKDLPEGLITTVFEVISNVWYFTHYEKYQEVKGIVEGANHPNLTLTKGILLNALYELESWCTSAIGQSASG